MKNKREKRETAFHEAGHSVVALHCDTIVHDVQLGPKPQMRYWPPHPPAVHVAGWAAVQILRVGRYGKVPLIVPLEDMGHHCGTDLQTFNDYAGLMIEEIYRPENRKLLHLGMIIMLNEPWREALAILSHHWRAVTLIADELLISGTMTGGRARELFEGCTPLGNGANGARRQGQESR